MIGVNISRKPLEIIFLATVFLIFMNNHNYGVVAQSKICTSYQCFLGLANANQLDAVSLNNMALPVVEFSRHLLLSIAP